MSIHWFAQFCYQNNNHALPHDAFIPYIYIWLTRICICCKPHPTRDETRDLQIVLPTTLTLLFFHTYGALHVRHIHAIFKLWGRPFCSSLLCLFLSFFVAMKGIQFTKLHCHISFFSFTRFTTCFLSSCGWLLNSCKCRLFCLHIQQAIRFSLNNESRLAHRRQQSAGSAFQFHYNHPLLRASFPNYILCPHRWVMVNRIISLNNNWNSLTVLN